MVFCLLVRILNPVGFCGKVISSQRGPDAMKEKIQDFPSDTASLFRDAGRILFQGGLNNSHSGNMSMRRGDRLVITRRGSMLGELAPGDLVEIPLEGEAPGLERASTEVNVHRGIYNSTGHLAIVHAHPRAAIALSMEREWIFPVDAEGKYYFTRIPVLAAKTTIGSKEVEEKIPGLLGSFPVVVVRGHGAFAGGTTLEEGFKALFSLEWSCEILCRCLALGMNEERLVKGQGGGE